MDPLSIIASTITVVQATASVYKAIQKLSGLPKEFHDVSRNLPLAENTLCLARSQLEGQTLDEPSKSALESCVRGCEAKAKTLRDIFKNLENGMAKGGSVLDFYRISLIRLGKANRVETLMQGILSDLDKLATNQQFRAATQIVSLGPKLKEAIKQLSEVKSSVPDSDFDSPGTNSQHIASGGTGYQSIIDGQDHKIVSGSGQLYTVSGNGHTLNFVQSSEDRKIRILRTLHTSPYRDRMNRNPDRVPGTCEWFVGHDYFKRWRDGKSSSMLWVSANPGCGKSVLAKYLVDSVPRTTESRTTCYFFFKDDFADQRTATGALCCILHQLFTERADLFSDKIVERFEAHIAHLTSSFDELWDTLVVVSQYVSAGEIVCILDAFDECADSERCKLASALRKFYDLENDAKNHANLKFLVTSRPYDKVGRGFQPLDIPGLPVIHLKAESDMELSKIAQEINVYMEYKVSHMQALKKEEKQQLLQKLQEIPSRTYLWVYLTIQWIESEINRIKISEVTSTLPRTVDQAYNRILAKSSDPREAKKLLHIIVAATRPLTLAEMHLALALKPQDRSDEEWDEDKNWDDKSEERFGKYVRDLCGLFVNITDSKIYLLHQTAKEFLVPKPVPDLHQDHPGRQTKSRGEDNINLRWKSSLQPAESHGILCKICIWHLLFSEFEFRPLDGNLDGQVSDYLREHVFLEYSAANWATHFRASGIEDDTVIESVRKICDSNSWRFRTWFRIYWAITQTGIPPVFTTLMVASYFGLDRIAELELELDDIEIDCTDGTYRRSALSWASGNGFESIVKLLIKGPKFRVKKVIKPWGLKGAKIDTIDRDNRTPLSYAAMNGHGAIVKRLVKAKARVDAEDVIGGTPMYYALCTGQNDLAKELLKGAHFGSVDDIRRKLLLSAATAGHEAVVKLLLENGADVEARDSDDATTLSLAATNGQVAVAQLLLDRSADVNARQQGNRTALARAIEHGSANIIEVLLKGGAKVDYSFKLSVSITA